MKKVRMGKARHAMGKASALLVLMLVGCSGPSIKTHPVTGKVELAGGDAAILAGSSIELKSDADETLRPIGNIDSAGNFTLTTLHQGAVVPGAPEGTYKARIVLADEGDEGIAKRPPNLVHRRYMNFETSGLKLTVPSGDYKIAVGSK